VHARRPTACQDGAVGDGASAIPRGSPVAHRLHQDRAVLEVFAGLGLLLFPVWVSLTFWWWIRLAPPAVRLARVYMAVGGLWSIWSCVQLLIAPAFSGRAHFVIQQHLGALVLLGALYTEIFVRWLRLRHRVDHPAPMWILPRSGRRRDPARLLAPP
jgi:hypothetical protein